MAGYPWKPIKDLPENWEGLRNQDLYHLASNWLERVKQLQNSDQLKDFNEKLTREWAIETGIIERLYSLDRGITQLFIERGIEASFIPHGTTEKSPALIVSIIRDQKEVVDGLFDFVVQRRELSPSYIKQMHQVFTRDQTSTDAVNSLGQLIEIPILRGDWKKWPNNPMRPDGTVHEYCPAEQVTSEMDRLISMHSVHNQKQVPPEVEAAWLHHRFAQIHPFQDGNGRIARALASLIFLRAGWFPLVITNEKRSEYIDALEQADSGNLVPLIQLFSRIEIAAFRNALRISDDLPTVQQSVDLLIAQGVERIQEKRIQKQSHAFDISLKLEEITHQRLSRVGDELDKKFKQIGHEYWASVTRSEVGISDHWYRAQVIQIANQMHYYANLFNYRAWIQLIIREERVANFTFSFHGQGAGQKFLGLMAVSAFLEFRTTSEEEDRGYEGPYQICQDIFQFSYEEGENEVITRYSAWLEEVLKIGLAEWQRRL